MCSEVATAASLPHSLTSGTASNPNRRHTLRSKSNINNPPVFHLAYPACLFFDSILDIPLLIIGSTTLPRKQRRK